MSENNVQYKIYGLFYIVNIIYRQYNFDLFKFGLSQFQLSDANCSRFHTIDFVSKKTHSLQKKLLWKEGKMRR